MLKVNILRFQLLLRKMPSLPAYWKYLDFMAIIGVSLAIIGCLVGMYVSYVAIEKLGLGTEVYLALICIFLAVAGIITTILVAMLSIRAMKKEMR